MSSPLELEIEKIRKNESQRPSFGKRIKVKLLEYGLSFFYNIHVNGSEKLDSVSKTRAQVIAWNHLSIIDPFIGLPCLIENGQEVHPLAKEEAWYEKGIMGAIYRVGLNLGPAIPINRQSPISSLREVKNLLTGNEKEGKINPPIPAWIPIAPEGTRSYSGALLDFEPAGVGLVLNSGAESVIPFNITYTLSKHRGRKGAYVNIGEAYVSQRDERGKINQNIVAEDLHGILSKLTTITIDHIIGSMIAIKAEKEENIDYSSIEQYLPNLLNQIKEAGYSIQPGLNDKSITKHIKSSLRFFEENGIMLNGVIDYARVRTSFKDYMLDKNKNGIESVELEGDDLNSKLSDEIKKVGKGFKKYNPVGYLVNNAGPEVVGIVRTAMK